MSTLRISNIEAKADNSSPTVDEQLKFTNSTGDVLLYLDGRTSGITTVGINTTAQTIKFDENNNVFITGIVTATELHGTVAVGTSVTYGDNEKAYFGTGLDLTIQHNGTNSVINNTTGSLLFQNGGSSSAWINSSGVIYTNNDILFQGASSNVVWDKSENYFTFPDKIAVHTGDSNTAIRFPADDTITFETNGAEEVRINSNGQLILGSNPTVAADAALHIELDGTREYLRLEGDVGTSNAYLEIEAPDNRRKAIIFKSGGTRRGVIGVGDSDEASATSLFFSASSNIAGNSPHMVIDSSGRLLLGTTAAPSSTNTLLRVHTPISSSSANSIEIGHDTNGADKAGAALGLAIANGGASTNAADLYFSTATNGSLVQRLWIKSDGKIGINRSAPRSTLDVFETVTGTQTAIRIGNSNTPSSANDRRIEFVDGTGTTEGTNKFTYAYIQAERAGGANSGDLILGTKRSNADAPAEAMRIDDNGHLHTGYTSSFGGDHINIVATDGGGISIGARATGNPSSGDLLGSLSFQGYMNVQTLSSSEARISAIASANHTGSSAATDLVFYTKPSTTGPGSAPTERVRINQHGQLAIRNYGGSAVSANLIAFGNADNTDVAIFSGGDWNRGLKISTAASGNNDAIVVLDAQNADNGCFSFKTHGDERLHIKADGRVLVNSTAVTNTDDFLTIKRPAGGHAVTSMTLDATTATGSYANALIFTKSKDYYYNGLVFESSTGHQGGIAAKMTAGGGSTPQIEIRIGGSGLNSSDKCAFTVHATGECTQDYVPAWSLRPSYNSNQTLGSGTHAVGWSSSSSGINAVNAFLQNVTLGGSTFGSNLHNGQNYGKIIVPVAGKYQINCSIRMENNPTAGNIWLYVNGSLTRRQHVEMWAHRPYMHGQITTVVELPANGHIIWAVTCNGGVVSGLNDYVNHCSGHLIG